MGGIDNVQAGSIPVSSFKAAALDAPTPEAPAKPQGTGALSDANQTRGGQAVLKAAASERDVVAYLGADLSFQDRTPRNGGSSVTPMATVPEARDTLTAYTADAMNQNQPTSWYTPVTEPLKEFVATLARIMLGEDKAFRSWGDPHEQTGDGLQLDNQLTGRFVAFKSDEGDLELQKDQGPDRSGRWPGMTLNHAVAMKVGTNRIGYDLASPDSLLVNGVRVPWKDGSSPLPDGSVVTLAGHKLSVYSPRGDVLTVERMAENSYLNLSGKISGSRPAGSVQGSLGNFDGDGNATNDLVTRSGTSVPVQTAAGRNSWEQIAYTPQIDAFLRSWLLKPGESLF